MTESWAERDGCDVQSSDVKLTQSPASARSLIMVTRLSHLGTMGWGVVGSGGSIPSCSEATQSASPGEGGSVEQTEAWEPPLTATSALRRSWTGSMHFEQPASTTCRSLSQEPVMQM